MFDIKMLLILIPALPLAAAILTAVLGKRVLREQSHWPTVAALLLSFVASIVLLFQVQKQIERPAEDYRPAAVTLWSWYNVPDAMPKPPAGGALPAGLGRLPHRHRLAGRPADGRHAGGGHLHFVAGGDLFDRLHARRSPAIGGSSPT